jgi:threonine/homoserine/homoserine lactone efflux protein
MYDRSPMWEYAIIGGSIAFAAAIQPGPLQAFLLSRVASVGWRATLPAALAPLISDGPIAILVLTVLHHLARGLESFLLGAGGFVFLYFSVATFLEWRRNDSRSQQKGVASPRTLLQAVAVNAVNPGPWIGWSLILGPLVLEAWSEAPVNAVTLIVAFYFVMVLTLALFIILFGITSFLGPRGRRGLLLVSSFILLCIAVYSFWSAFS